MTTRPLTIHSRAPFDFAQGERVRLGGTMTSDGEELVAYCGLYCGDCFGYQGKVADLARDLRKELRGARFDKTAEVLSQYSFFDVFKDYSRCYEVLGALVKLRCKKACRSGGGPPFCKMRKCCVKKGIDGCWECDEFETCEKLGFLSANHGDAHFRNLRAIRKRGISGFVAGKRHWYAQPKRRAAQPDSPRRED